MYGDLVAEFFLEKYFGQSRDCSVLGPPDISNIKLSAISSALPLPPPPQLAARVTTTSKRPKSVAFIDVPTLSVRLP